MPQTFAKKMKIAHVTPFLVIGALVYLLAVGCKSKKPPSTQERRSPFHSVIVRDNSIVATLPNAPRWQVREGSDESRLTEPSESFILKDGSSLKLFERHSSYLVTAELTPRQGLKIESRFDARSFGDGVTQAEYFISALTPMPDTKKKANKSEQATPRKPSD